MVFLYCVFSHVASNCLHVPKQSHIDCICLTFLRCTTGVPLVYLSQRRVGGEGRPPEDSNILTWQPVRPSAATRPGSTLSTCSNIALSFRSSDTIFPPNSDQGSSKEWSAWHHMGRWVVSPGFLKLRVFFISSPDRADIWCYSLAPSKHFVLASTKTKYAFVIHGTVGTDRKAGAA